jgi:hypothetical protein
MRVPIVEFNMLQRLRCTSDFFFTLAEREREKGDCADVTFILEMMQSGAMWAAKAAPYVHPKVAEMQFGVGEPQRHSIDLGKLTDDELMAFERLVRKSQMAVRDEVEESVPRTADEYLPSTKPIDARKSVGGRAGKTTNDEPDSKSKQRSAD